MFILINGAFGIGKTTIARELRTRLSGLIFDPELFGFVLQRLPGYRGSDFQDLASWRRLTIAGARALAVVKRPVIIPMAFSDVRYLDEVRTGLAAAGDPVLHFCLTAPLVTVQQRLADRGERDQPGSWVYRRAAECCHAHTAAAFAIHINTEDRTPQEIAAEIAARTRTSVSESSA